MSDNLPQGLKDQEISGHSISLHQQTPGTPVDCVALDLVIGTDRFSAGMTVYSVTPSRGRYASRRAIVRARWRLGPKTTEEAVRSAIMGLQAWLAEQGYDLQ
jgi:hypothetical protein